MKSIAVVIVAGGSGTRMGGDRAKQYLDLGGIPILCHTVRAFAELLTDQDHIILVVPDKDRSYVRQIIEQHCPPFQNLSLTAGGATRAESVQNGLRAVPDQAALIAVHDGVRPFVTAELWHTITAALEAGHPAVIPARHPIESVRIQDGESSASLDRDEVYLIQTPQTFEARVLREAYHAYRLNPHPWLTDDAGIVTEYLGIRPHLVAGIEQNIKITTPKDLYLAEWFLTQSGTPPRSTL